MEVNVNPHTVVRNSIEIVQVLFSQFPSMMMTVQYYNRKLTLISISTDIYQFYSDFVIFTCTRVCMCLGSMKFYHMFRFVFLSLSAKDKTVTLLQWSFLLPLYSHDDLSSPISTPIWPLATTNLFYILIILSF